jgi:hypothetical protein
MIRLLISILISLFLLASGEARADTATGTSPQVILAPGLCAGSSCSSYNGSTQALAPGSTMAQQVFVATVGAAGTQPVVGTDAGKLWIATVSGVTFSVYAPGANGTAGANFGFDGAHAYSVTSSATIYGCGPPGTTITLAYDATLSTDGTNWKCSASAPSLAVAAGISATLAPPIETYFCTGTCTVTVPPPAPGYYFCVALDDNVTAQITLAALGSGAQYEKTARNGYGTAGTGTMISSGAIGDKVCITGKDATHYETLISTGTWTVN